MALTDKLTAIANAIRSKTGKTNTMTLDQMATEIEGISGGGIEPFELNLDSDIRNQGFVSMLKILGEGTVTKIKTKGSLTEAFKSAPDVGIKIPDIEHTSPSYTNMDDMFRYSTIKSENLPKISCSYSMYSISSLFANSALEYIPEDFFDSIPLSTNGPRNSVFNSCRKLRRIPKNVFEKINVGHPWYSNSFMYSAFYTCFTLGELDGIKVIDEDGSASSNMFYNTFNSCYMLKRVVFATNEGQPYVLKIKSQAIDLSERVGYAYNTKNIIDNSSMTTANQVIDDTTYNNLKDTEDWFTTDVNYSRYNKTSAVETINSLPDTSAYLAANGGTNTIKFNGASGSKTDGGAINTMTEEEIAVATAKGWTVTFAQEEQNERTSVSNNKV